ncbi:hypothetical protein AYI87_18295 [Shewanella sp. KCT]|nr:hypothetical protein AYI87_18295 [Shewanella sp. KCT]
MYWRTLHRAVGAEDAAVAGEGFENLVAALAFVEELAGILGHGLHTLMTAVGTSDLGFELDRISHNNLTQGSSP